MPQVAEDTQIKDLKEKVLNLVSNYQTESKARAKHDETVDLALVEMKDGAAKFLEDFQGLTVSKKLLEERIEKAEAALEVAKKRGDDLEVAMSLRAYAQTGDSKDLHVSNEEYKEIFQDGVREKFVNYKMPQDVAEDELTRYVKYKRPFASKKTVAWIVKQVSEAYGPSLGMMVPVDMQAMTEQRKYELTPMRQLATVIPMDRSMAFPVWDTFIEPDSRGELGPQPTETPIKEANLIRIDLNEMHVLPKVTQDMLRNRAFDVEGWIMRDFVPRGFAIKESRDFTIGDGVQRARGLFTYDSWADEEIYERDALGTLVTGGSTIDFDNLKNLNMSLQEGYWSMARWLMHRYTFSHIIGLKDNEDRPLINPQLLFLGTELRLFGREVYLGGDVPHPTLTGTFTVGQKVIAYGDFSAYIIGDGMPGLSYTIRDEITQLGFVRWFVTQQIGGKLIGFQSIKILEIGS